MSAKNPCPSCPMWSMRSYHILPMSPNKIDKLNPTKMGVNFFFHFSRDHYASSLGDVCGILWLNDGECC